MFAVVPTLTPVLQSSTFLTQQHVPFFGWGISAGFCKNPFAFGFTGCIVPPPSIPTTGTTWGALASAYFKSHGSPGGSKGKTAAVIAEDLDTGKTGALVIGEQAKVAGFKVVYQKNPIPANPPPGDYSPYVTALMTSNAGKPPDVIFVTTAFNNVLGLSGALLKAGFQGLLTNAVTYDPRLVSSAKGQTVFTQFDLPEDTANATMQKITSDIKAVAGRVLLGRRVRRRAEEGGQEPDTRGIGEGHGILHLPGSRDRRAHEVPRGADPGCTVRPADAERRHEVQHRGAVRLLPGHQLQDREADQVLDV